MPPSPGGAAAVQKLFPNTAGVFVELRHRQPVAGLPPELAGSDSRKESRGVLPPSSRTVRQYPLTPWPCVSGQILTVVQILVQLPAQARGTELLQILLFLASLRNTALPVSPALLQGPFLKQKPRQWH